MNDFEFLGTPDESFIMCLAATFKEEMEIGVIFQGISVFFRGCFWYKFLCFCV